MTFLDLIGPGRAIDPAVIQASAARGDDWYPYAAVMPLTPEATSQPRGEKTTFILHSMAGPALTSLEALWRYMNRTDITGECTWIGDLAGRVAQTVPVNVRADNNFKANPFATSIETQDLGSATLATTPWSDPLMAQLAGLSAWQVMHPLLDVPLRRADQGWDGGGIDGHRRYAEWSKYIGKTCPGQARWEQIDDVLTGARLIVEWTPATPLPPTPPPTQSADPTITLEDPMIVAKTTDGGHYASLGYRTGAFHIGTQMTLEAAFVSGVALDASSGYPLKKVTAAGWPASVAKVTKAQAFAILGDPI